MRMRPSGLHVHARGSALLAECLDFAALFTSFFRSISTPTPPGPSSSFSARTTTRVTRGFSRTNAATCSASVSASSMWPLRDDGAYAVHDEIVGNDVAHVFRVAGHPQDIGRHIEAHVLRLAMLEAVGADVYGQYEVADEDLVGTKPRPPPGRGSSRARRGACSRPRVARQAPSALGYQVRVSSRSPAHRSGAVPAQDPAHSAPRKPRKSGLHRPTAAGRPAPGASRQRRTFNPCDWPSLTNLPDLVRRHVVEQAGRPTCLAVSIITPWNPADCRAARPDLRS